MAINMRALGPSFFCGTKAEEEECDDILYVHNICDILYLAFHMYIF